MKNGQRMIISDRLSCMNLSTLNYQLSIIYRFSLRYYSIFSSLCVCSLTRVREVSHTCGELVAHVCDMFFIRTQREYMLVRKYSFVLMKRLIHSDAFFNEFRAVNISAKSLFYISPASILSLCPALFSGLVTIIYLGRES
jgi:hypothetical protein